MIPSISFTAAPAGNPAVTQEQYAASIAESESSIRSLTDTVDRLKPGLSDLDQDMYGHQSMGEAVANDTRRAQAALSSCLTTAVVSFGVAAAAAVGCFAYSGWLGAIAVAAAMVGASAVSTRNRALKALPGLASMRECVDRETEKTTRQRTELESRINDATRNLAAERAKLELLEVARRASAPRPEGAAITHDEGTLRIGGIAVPKRDARS